MSRARQELTGADLAPKTLDTLAELQGRRPQVRERHGHSPERDGICARQACAVRSHIVHEVFAQRTLRQCVRSRRMHERDASSMFGRHGLFQLLFRAAEDFATADMPEPVRKAFMSATMTALQKPYGGVRGIATTTSFLRFVARTLARQFGKAVEAICAPFQFALSTRAGTDCVGHAIRALTDANPSTTILSIDGIGAYDHVYRSAFFQKLLNVPLQGLLPFVRATYADPTSYAWVDEAGEVHHIVQAEGGEQGDPLMPLLFSLAIHDPLEEVSRERKPEEHLFAYLDDAYFSGDVPNRTRTVYDSLGRRQGFDCTVAKPESGIEHPCALREWRNWDPSEVWNPEGVNLLGTPVGSRAFVDEVLNKRLREEHKLWEAIPWVPDLQAGWQILIQCAGPRCHHIIRTLPPSQSADYAQGHDEGIKRTMDNLL